jgi:malonyl CoA-acyl carrier protein transacylase
MAEDALATALGMYVREREDIPVPSTAVAGQALVAVPTIVAAKLALSTAMRRQGITQSDASVRERGESRESASDSPLTPSRPRVLC